MFQIGDEKVWCGDFHGQWCEPPENLPLYLAALTVCGHDFSLFNSGDTSPTGPFNALVEKLGIKFLVLPYGRELFYDWAHIMVGGLHPDAEVPGVSESDCRSVLKRLRTQCDFISVAHPRADFVPWLDALLDAGLIDSVAYIEPHIPELNGWYRNRLATGKHTPIVAELDFHVTKGRRQGLIHYQTASDAELDLPPVAQRTTLVFCEELTADAIYAAVRAGRSCVDLRGELYGPPKLVEKLEKAEYREQKAEALRKREMLMLKVENGITPIEGEPFRLDASCGERRWSISIPAPVNPAAQERFFVPVVDDDQVRAVEVMAAQEARILPGWEAGKEVIAIKVANNSLLKPASGSFELEANGTLFRQEYRDILPGGFRNFIFPASEHSDGIATLTLRPNGLPSHTVKRDLLWVKIPYSTELREEDWEKAFPIRLNSPEQLDPAWSDEWRGAEDSSADIRLLWNDDALYLRAKIIDSVLAPSAQPRFLFMGDSLQIGINPFDDPAVNLFSFYHFLSTRGGQPGGDEFCRADNVPSVGARFHRTPPYRLPEQCFRLEHHENHRSTLNLTFPWHLLPLIAPRRGTRIQLHFILWDNDGDGLKASLHWPRPGVWYLPTDGTWSSAELF